MTDLQTFLELCVNEPNCYISSKLISRYDAISLFLANDIDKLRTFYCGTETYDDIDFTNVQINLECWATDRLLQVQFPQWNKDYWENRIENSTVDSFKERDASLPQEVRSDRIDHWIKYGTWKLPIIIFNSANFEDSNLQKPYQLFEGHNRLERLKVIHKDSSLKLAETHFVFVISK